MQPGSHRQPPRGLRIHRSASVFARMTQSGLIPSSIRDPWNPVRQPLEKGKGAPSDVSAQDRRISYPSTLQIRPCCHRVSCHRVTRRGRRTTASVLTPLMSIDDARRRTAASRHEEGRGGRRRTVVLRTQRAEDSLARKNKRPAPPCPLVVSEKGLVTDTLRVDARIQLFITAQTGIIF